MKKNIHPKYYPEAKVICACGNTWTTGSTMEILKADICSKCHPFFTGQGQRLIDTGGQVSRFSKRFDRANVLSVEAKERATARTQRERARALVEIVDEDEIQPIADLSENGGDK